MSIEIGRLWRIVAAAVFLSPGCAAPSFDPANEVESVRVLAIRADSPYAPPGATVTLDMLAVDGRASKSPPLTAAWIRQPCINPAADAYYACFPGFARQFAAGADLTNQLETGTRLSIQLPGDIITTHGATSGQAPYGLAIAFAVACAGHVEYRPELGAAAPDAVPFACFDSSERRLGADDFVFAYALVYSFTARTNKNPQIGAITKDGTNIDIDAGFTLSRCEKSTLTDCPTTSIDTSVPASSQEDDPGLLDANGNPLKEEIWVDYYVTGTQMQNDTIVLYDPSGGALSNTGDKLYAPQSAGQKVLWAVVHDDRGGVSWVQTTFVAK